MNFKELKKLQCILSLELNDASTSNLPLENYTGYLLNHRLYSKFCSSLSRLSMYFVQPTCRSSYNGAYDHPLNYFSLSLLWCTVNMLFLSPHLYYGTVYRILLKIQHLFHLLNLPSKHSYLGNLIFDLYYDELYQAFTSPHSKLIISFNTVLSKCAQKTSYNIIKDALRACLALFSLRL